MICWVMALATVFLVAQVELEEAFLPVFFFFAVFGMFLRFVLRVSNS